MAMSNGAQFERLLKQTQWRTQYMVRKEREHIGKEHADSDDHCVEAVITLTREHLKTDLLPEWIYSEWRLAAQNAAEKLPNGVVGAQFPRALKVWGTQEVCDPLSGPGLANVSHCAKLVEARPASSATHTRVIGTESDGHD